MDQIYGNHYRDTYSACSNWWRKEDRRERVDGYHECENGVKTVFEYHGCFWHGCIKCFSRHTVNPVNQMTMADLYQRTLEKKHYLESLGFTYISIWKCEFDREILDNLDVKSFVDKVNFVTPLETREAFAGGRTEAFKVYHEAKGNEAINYYDMTSLYPYINKMGKAVLGHPMVITENIRNVSKYEGLIKCKVYPPRKLHIPVLPTKINNKLLFALCKTYAESWQ